MRCGHRLTDLGHAGGRTGSVTAIQRGFSALRLSPHIHGAFLDGVPVEQGDADLSFVELPELSDLDVCEVLSTIVARVLGHLRGATRRPRPLRLHADLDPPRQHPYNGSTDWGGVTCDPVRQTLEVLCTRRATTSPLNLRAPVPSQRTATSTRSSTSFVSGSVRRPVVIR
jgi:hypothetical protein